MTETRYGQEMQMRYRNFSIELDCAPGTPRPSDLIGYVLEGQLEVDFDGDIVVLKTGDGLFIPPGDENKHMAKILTDAVRIVLVEDV